MKPINELPSFKRFCVTIGNLPSSYVDSMSYYDCLMWLCKYLKDTVIPAVNENAEVLTELQQSFISLKEYVDTYFENLDVQAEINNKLDEMAESGELGEIVATYFNPIIEEQNNKIELQNDKIESIEDKVDSAVNAYPLVADSINEMTDTTKIYILTTDGHWYYYDEVESSWLSGGIYFENVNFTRTIIVDNNGAGNFNDIQSAIDYATTNYDVANVPVTIFVKNGIYNISPKATSPYYAINKGTNKISIIGESKEHTIINCTCTDMLQGSALNIGGDCIIANLTINNLADPSFNSGTILEGNHRPYCIHNDGIIVGNTVEYNTTVKNCKLYSECYTPLGAGLHHLQTQQYIDCEFIYNSNIYNTEGSFYIHSSYDNTATPKGLEVINCSIISKNNAPCIFTTNIAGSLNMGQIPQTYQRNILYTTGANELNMVGLGGVTNWSKMNTNSSLNK